MNSNEFIAERLNRLGELLELKGENIFKVRAYYNAAEAIESLPDSIQSYISGNTLGSISGVGDAIRAKVVQIFETGTCPMLEKLELEIPEGVVEMLRIKGLGPKKITVIWQQLGITSVGELYYACLENRLVEVKGFGEKTQEKIRQSIEFMRANESRFHYATLYPYAQQLLKQLQSLPGGDMISLTGEIRRKMPVLEHIDVLAPASLREAILSAISANEIYVVSSATDEIAVQWKDTSVKALIRFAEGNFATALFRSTGSETHISQVAVKDSADYKDEAAIYAGAKLSYIEPELRENTGEIELAAAGTLPVLLTMKDVKGSLHNHSAWSDGIHSIEEMAEACKSRGWTYFGISDHSKTAFYANGLSEERIVKQHAEIDALNAKLAPFRIFKGIESDILNDGSLDYPDDVLATFDFVVASVHSQLSMDEAKATARLIRAIENPYTTILGHPTGRLLLVRSGYPIDHIKIIDACAANHVIIEINANPHRLDLDWTWIPYALEKGVMLSINPDAHKTAGFDDTFWGIEVARKGMLTADRTLNCGTAETVEKIFRAKRTVAKS